MRSLFRLKSVEQELDEELRYHIEQQIQHYLAKGLSAKEARYMALREIGGVDQQKERCRTMRRVKIIETVIQDLRYSLRTLKKNPSFAIAAILTLALGVGANVAVFTVIEAVLLRPFNYADADKLVILKHRDQRTGITKEFIAIGDYVDLTARQSSFETISGYGSRQATVSVIDQPFQINALAAGPELLDALRTHIILGRGFQADDSRPGAPLVTIIGYDFWQAHFGGDHNVIGRGLKIDQQDVQIVGVAPAGFQFPPNSQTDLILPLTLPTQAPTARKSDWTFALARLKSGATLKSATTDLATISKQLEHDYPKSNQASEYFPVPLRDALVGDTKPALMMLLAAVGVVLLIACANVANLLLARSLARSQEMAIRRALGASRARLMAQLLTESLTLTFGAGLVSVLIANWGAKALVTLVPATINVPGLSDIHTNVRVVVFALAVCVITALVIGLVSTMTLRSDNSPSALGAPTRMSISAAARRTTSALVIAEIALAIVLLIGAGLILRSFSRLLSVDPGFRLDGLVTTTIQIPFNRYNSVQSLQSFYSRTFEALHASGEIKEVGAAVVTPLTGNNWTIEFERPEHPVPAGERPPEVGWQLASGSYFKVLQIPLLSGRLFNETDTPNGKQVVIISEAIQKRFFPNENPIGKQVKLGNEKMEIVGVVGNIRRADLRDQPRADMYFAFESRPSSQIALFIRGSSDSTRIFATVRDKVRSIEPNAIFLDERTFKDIADQSIGQMKLAMWLLGIFAATALALAAVGVYGVMSYGVRQRTREIGTRVALGATRADILWLVMRQGAVIAFTGIAIGVGAGLLATRALATMLYGISSTDPITLGLASVALFATTTAACYLPARRAASVDPARTLAEQ